MHLFLSRKNLQEKRNKANSKYVQQPLSISDSVLKVNEINANGKLHADQEEPKTRNIKTLKSCTSTSKEVKQYYPKTSTVQQTWFLTVSGTKIKELTVRDIECIFHASLDKSDKF